MPMQMQRMCCWYATDGGGSIRLFSAGVFAVLLTIACMCMCMCMCVCVCCAHAGPVLRVGPFGAQSSLQQRATRQCGSGGDTDRHASIAGHSAAAASDGTVLRLDPRSVYRWMWMWMWMRFKLRGVNNHPASLVCIFRESDSCCGGLLDSRWTSTIPTVWWGCWGRLGSVGASMSFRICANNWKGRLA